MRAPTTRTVDPVKVHIADGQWYLQGWCHLREAMRTFHLDRVSDLELTDIPITHGEEPVPGWFDADAGDVVASIRFPESVAPLLGEYLDRAAVEYGGRRRRSRRCASPTSSACGAWQPGAAETSRSSSRPRRAERPSSGRRRGSRSIRESRSAVAGGLATGRDPGGYTETGPAERNTTCCKALQGGTS